MFDLLENANGFLFFCQDRQLVCFVRSFVENYKRFSGVDDKALGEWLII